jgi:hypothetical protein
MLRERVEQRFQATAKAFDPSAFDSMRALIVQMFLKLEPTAMLTMEELKDEFEVRYPNINSANIPRRVFELSQPDGKFGHKLGRKQDGDVVRYFLWLQESVQVVSGMLEQKQEIAQNLEKARLQTRP